MQKVWSFAIIALVGIMMITSSLPQEVFAGKETLKLNLRVLDGDGKVQGTECRASLTQVGAETDGGLYLATDNTGKSGRVSLTFEKSALGEEDGVWVYCTGSLKPAQFFPIDSKNQQSVYFYNF